LEKDGLDKMMTACSSDHSDCVEEYLGLKNRMVDHLNFMGPNNEVLSLGSDYGLAIKLWFPIRKRFYELRVSREKILLGLRILRLENIVRYVNLCNSLKLSKKKLADMDNIMTANKFQRIYSARLQSPKFVETEQLEQIILRSSKADYNYLLDMSDSKKSEEYLKKYEMELETLKTKLRELEILSARGKFTGAHIWLKELEMLRAVMTEGMLSFWKYGETTKYELN
jgi:hypothetical protein